MPRILIVDDHAPTRRAMATLLAHEGWEIAEAANFADGLAALDPPPDCAVLDIVLPDGEGERIAEEIATRGLLTRVVFCTGASDLDRLAAAPGRVLIKPVRVDDLIAALGY